MIKRGFLITWAILISLFLYGNGIRFTYELYLPEDPSALSSQEVSMLKWEAFGLALFWPATLPLRLGWMLGGVVPKP